MTPYATFHGIRFFNCYATDLTSELKEGVLALWRRSGILPRNADPEKRIKQLVLAAVTAEGAVIGVNTVYPGQFVPQPDGYAPVDCLFYRTFIEPAGRRPQMMRAMLEHAYAILHNVHSGQKGPRALAIVTENLSLTRRGTVRTMNRLGWRTECSLPDGKMLLVRPFREGGAEQS